MAVAMRLSRPVSSVSVGMTTAPSHRCGTISAGRSSTSCSRQAWRIRRHSTELSGVLSKLQLCGTLRELSGALIDDLPLASGGGVSSWLLGKSAVQHVTAFGVAVGLELHGEGANGESEEIGDNDRK